MEDSSETSARRNGQQYVPSPQALEGANGASALPGAQHPAQAVLQNGDLRSQKRWRIALYSHDTKGLGHIRRNLLLAHMLSSSSLQVTILLIAGAREAGAFTMPPHTDCLILPAFSKETGGQYRSRCLDISLEELVAVRAKAIRAALEGFEPDVLIVDYSLRGAVRELEPTLKYLRGLTRCVFGVRDILSDPAVLQHEWGRAANMEALREYYDRVWVYGDPAVYDLVREYHFPPDVAAKVRYTGYLDQRLRLAFADQLEGSDPLAGLSLPPGRLLLCLVGGGQDGGRLAEAFAEAELPPQTNGVIVTGPFMPQETQQRLRQRAATQPRLRVIEFVREPALLLQQADRVVAMGGYNTICEILSFERRALIVPRVNARREQPMRVERLRDLGLLEVLHPDELSPRTLSEWLARDLEPLPRVRDRIDLNGLARLPGLLEEVLATRPQPARSKLEEGSL